MGRVLEQLATSVGDREASSRAAVEPGETGLTARLRTGELALDAVAFFAGQAARLLGLPSVTVNPRRVGVNLSSFNFLSVNGVAAAAWGPLSGFFAARDGWLRTHANYPHHHARLCAAFGLAETAGRSELAAALALLSAADAEALATAAGALCVRVRRPEEFAALIEPAPLLDWSAGGRGSGGRGANGQSAAGKARARAARPRVLDLSRVIAGPTCTRALALLGADVLRVDPVRPAEIAAQHVDTGAGKRSAVLDLAAAGPRLEGLLAGADVVVLGYRPGSLDRFGLAERALRARHPHLVIAALSAYPGGSVWAERRGFDSLVQAASGIAVLEGGVDKPGALRAQALDHATGYALAGGICAALAEGRAATMHASLGATAQALLALGPAERAEKPLPADAAELAADLETVPSADGPVRRARAVIDIAGHQQGPVAPLGSAEPVWLDGDSG